MSSGRPLCISENHRNSVNKNFFRFRESFKIIDFRNSTKKKINLNTEKFTIFRWLFMNHNLTLSKLHNTIIICISSFFTPPTTYTYYKILTWYLIWMFIFIYLRHCFNNNYKLLQIRQNILHKMTLMDWLVLGYQISVFRLLNRYNYFVDWKNNLLNILYRSIPAMFYIYIYYYLFVFNIHIFI